MVDIKKVACIGGGVIGGGWAARMIENGIDVVIHDPDPDAKSKIDAVLANAERAYAKLTMAPRPKKGSISYSDSIADAVVGADLIIESVPERLEIKQAVYAEVEQAAASDAIIVSSTSGILPTDLQANLQQPERLLVAHPFNPVYLLPLVELVAGKNTDQKYIEWGKEFYSSLGMYPLHCRVEIDGFISDRLQEALWREALWLLHDNVATAEEIDAAIAYGPGLRWAQMGTMQTFHLAGGDGGMRAMLAMFGPCLKWPWTKLMDVPELTDDFINQISDQCEQQAGDLSPRDLEIIRDDNLVSILQSLKVNDWGAGTLLGEHEKKLYNTSNVVTEDIDLSQPIITLERTVPPDWTDYNNHMNESRYLQCFSDASDTFLRMIGVNDAYVKAGKSYFTVETHIQHIDEVKALEPIYATSQVMLAKGKKLQLFNRLHHKDGRLLATGEHMYIHVDLNSRSACDPDDQVLTRAAKYATAHADLPHPDGAGRSIGQSR